MITPIEVRDEYGDLGDKYFVVIDGDWSKSDFVRAADVGDGSYAHELTERVYDCIVTHAVDIRQEYVKYYSQEYSDLETFLFWKYDVDMTVTSEVTEGLKRGDLWGYGSVYWGGDYNLGQFIMSEVGLELVNQVFDKMREASGANQN